MTVPETGAEILARIKPKLDEDWVEICLRPDLAVEHEELDSDLQESKINDAKRPLRNGMEAPPSEKTVDLEARVLALEEEMIESSVKFAFRALSRDKFRALCDQHPPRRGDQYDTAVGYNRSGLGDALVRASLVEPEFDDTSWAELLEVVSVGEWNRLQQVAEKVNGRVVTESPKSLWVSRTPSSPDSD